jgi:hypothetical protein
MNHTNILISGKITSGKTYLTEQLILLGKKYGIHYKKLAFAKRLKELCYELFDMQQGDNNKNRDLLVNFAQKMRDIDQDVWIRPVLREINDNPTSTFIIEDGRFPNEIINVKNKGFYCIRLEINEDIQKQRIIEKYGDKWESHWNNRHDISDTAVDNMDDMWDEVWNVNYWPDLESWWYKLNGYDKKI